MTTAQPMSFGALYYPYIHIYDVNWLRANLLIFPRMKRMVPMTMIPRDQPELAPFTEWQSNREALLQPADLFSDRSTRAQSSLAGKLRNRAGDPEFVKEFGQDEARRLAVAGDPFGFQIHADKLSTDLQSALRENSLCWKPVYGEPYDAASGYIEVHPRVGEAVMSTLAIACAQSGGLSIVGDKRSGPLHRCLLEKDLGSIFDAWLGADVTLAPPGGASGEELMEFVLGMPGDLSALSVERLHELAEEREPVEDLIAALREHAARIPAMDPGDDRDEAFKQAASEVLQKWESDRRNWRGFWRNFFGRDSAKLATDFAGKVADKTLSGLAGGAAAKGAAVAAAGSAGWLGSLAAGGIIGAGAGLVVGLIAHAGTTLYNLRQREENSPYRFLTTLQGVGVVRRGRRSEFALLGQATGRPDLILSAM